MDVTTIPDTEEEWRGVLTPSQYHVLREKGTERAFTGEYWNHFEPGVYACAGCGEALFDSAAKFDSHCGWPSFSDVLLPHKVVKREDTSHGMRRIEVLCARCGGHLGHVFPDGPAPTRVRFCINSASLRFHENKGNQG
jgi:methionine-R-sulfoxide reductase